MKALADKWHQAVQAAAMDLERPAFSEQEQAMLTAFVEKVQELSPDFPLGQKTMQEGGSNATFYPRLLKNIADQLEGVALLQGYEQEKRAAREGDETGVQAEHFAKMLTFISLCQGEYGAGRDAAWDLARTLVPEAHTPHLIRAGRAHPARGNLTQAAHRAEAHMKTELGYHEKFEAVADTWRSYVEEIAAGLGLKDSIEPAPVRDRQALKALEVAVGQTSGQSSHTEALAQKETGARSSGFHTH